MSTFQFRAVLAAMLGLSLITSACGSSGGGSPSGQNKGTVTVAGFNFSESSILANIYAKSLKNKGYTATVKANLGSREIVEPALEKGEIDLYPGYAATELEFVNKGAGEATPDAKATVDKLNSRLSSKGIKALEPSSAIDANAFAVTKATADKYHLKKMSDLSSVAGNLTLGGPPECPTRPFCEAGLKKTYGLNFKAFKALDAGGPLSKGALEKGDVDVILIFSSDGAIAAKGFTVLEDDKHLQNADNVVPVIRTKVANDEVTSLLNSISSKLKTSDLVSLNKKADIDKEDPEALADKWVKDNGF
jgi:osmoprotectant transport system substrate-binding protein